jgi:prophage regulatory protein
MTNRILRLPEIKARTGLSRSSIYLKSKNDPDFPSLVSIGARAVGMHSDPLDKWIGSRLPSSERERTS